MDVVYRFSGFRVDPVRRLLFGRDGQPIALKPRVFDTLLYLVEHRGELLDKQALLDAVWPGVVVEENNLNQAISALRRVFGETRGENTFIVTDPGRGYRFVAAVETVQAVPVGSDVEASAPAVSAAPVAATMNRTRPRWWMAASALVLAGAVGASGFWLLTRDEDGTWFRQVAIPQIESNIAVGAWATAFEIAAEAQARLGDSAEVEEIWPRLSWTTTIDSEPRGATVYLRPYASDESAWKEIGRTPLENIRIPYGLSRLKLELDGYLTLTRTLGGGVPRRDLGPRGDLVDHPGFVGTDLYRLDTSATLPEGKVRVPGWTELIDGAPVTFADYFLDRTEVTNTQFKAFVDAGGYENPDFWDPVVRDGEVVPWAEAMQLFMDGSGRRRGPSTWQAGSFRIGEEDFPVAGISWYEAAAFARYRRQQLPTAYHWRRARAQGEVPWLMAESNLASTGPRAVSESKAMSFVGAYDLAGNQREWTASPAGDSRIIAGGSWDDEPFVAAGPSA